MQVAQIRVLYADTDQMGVVNNVDYLRCFEIGARRVAARSAAAPTRSSRQLGYMLPVVEAHLRYREPARYDDLLDVEVTAADEVRGASLRFRYALRRARDGALLCEGWTTHACIWRRRQGRARFPTQLLSYARDPDQQENLSTEWRWIATSRWRWCASPRRRRCRARAGWAAATPRAPTRPRSTRCGAPSTACDIRGTVVIGEGERDEAPMLFIGEQVGAGWHDGATTSPKVDIAVDPLEGTNLCATGAPDAHRGDRDRRRRQVPERARHLHGEDRRRPGGRGRHRHHQVADLEPAARSPRPRARRSRS